MLSITVSVQQDSGGFSQCNKARKSSKSPKNWKGRNKWLFSETGSLCGPDWPGAPRLKQPFCVGLQVLRTTGMYHHVARQFCGCVLRKSKLLELASLQGC
jgi:hypothetical protein